LIVCLLKPNFSEHYTKLGKDRVSKIPGTTFAEKQKPFATRVQQEIIKYHIFKAERVTVPFNSALG